MTLAEIVVSAALTLSLMAAVFGLVHPAQAALQLQPEASDMQQRLRVSIDVLLKDLVMAGAGLDPLVEPPVTPYRIGRENSDEAAGIFYRPDTISVRYLPRDGDAPVSHTYYLRRDPASDTPQLAHYDGLQTDLAVVDHVVKLEFEYYAAGEEALGPAVLQDGPWVTSEAGEMAFDADLLRIRRLRVALRVQAVLASMRGPSGVLFSRGGASTSAARFLPDLELRFDVAPRNLNLQR